MIYIIDFGSSKTQSIASVISSIGYVNKVFKWDENFDMEKAKAVFKSRE